MAAVNKVCTGAGAVNMVESDVKVGVMCCALHSFDDQWYRAMVINADLQNLTVRYVDYGNEEKVSLENLRLMNRDILRKHQALAVPCRLSGFPENLSKDLILKFKDLVVDKTLTMDVIQWNTTVPYVEVKLFDENGDDVTKQLSSPADNCVSSTCSIDKSDSTTVEVDAQGPDKHNWGHQEGSSFSRAPRDEGSFNRGLRAESSSCKGPDEVSRGSPQDVSRNRESGQYGSLSLLQEYMTKMAFTDLLPFPASNDAEYKSSNC